MVPKSVNILVGIWIPNVNNYRNYHQVHDPHGIAISYLLGGADYVVANLWDVTDKDIDKLSIECMRIYFDHMKSVEIIETSSSDWGGTISAKDVVCNSLSGALVTSRSVCKMQNVVGCAPVIYGLPLKHPCFM